MRCCWKSWGYKSAQEKCLVFEEVVWGMWHDDDVEGFGANTASARVGFDGDVKTWGSGDGVGGSNGGEWGRL